MHFKMSPFYFLIEMLIAMFFKIHKLAFNAENVSEIRVYNDFVRYRQIYIL